MFKYLQECQFLEIFLIFNLSENNYLQFAKFDRAVHFMIKLYYANFYVFKL